jgi:protein phosphatase
MGYRVVAAGQTDVGMKRGHNEDSLHVENPHQLYVVADGMGGHSSGEVASQLAVETVLEFYLKTHEDEDKTWPFKMNRKYSYEENRMMVGVRYANRRIFDHAQADLRKKGMGTTIVSMFINDEHAYIGHVGDSRVYVLREGSIRQITEDHSLLNDYMKIKKLTQEEIDNFPHKNVIVRALGMKGDVQVDVLKEDAREGDIFLMCSDGLSGLVSDPEMLDIGEKNADSLQQGCQDLIDLANKRGGNDNITVILAKIVKE